MYQLKNITQNEIEKMIDDGRKIYWENSGYPVIKDKIGQYLINHISSCVGLNSVFQQEEFSNQFYEVKNERL